MTGMKNTAAELLKSSKKISAAWAQAGSNITAEILGMSGFDVVMIDMEHGPGEIMTLISQVQALQGSPAVPFVRAPWNDFVQIKRILDAGVYGLLVPYVNTVQEVRDAVKAVKYPPQGIRGVAGSPRAPGYGKHTADYLSLADEEILLFTAVETPEAVSHIDEMVSEPGVDGIFIGPMDLATSMGYRGDPSAEEVKRAVSRVEDAVLKSGKYLATASGSWEQAKGLYERGYNLLVFFSDTVSLGNHARSAVKEFNSAFRS